MPAESHLTFGPFRLDLTQGRLWRGEQVLPLRPRSLALLGYLVMHPGRLVTKDEVQAQVGGGTHVTASVLRVSVQEIRAALGDVAGAPRYLATVGGQGYRFLVGRAPKGPALLAAGPVVGRQGAVAAVAAWYQQAVQGTRQLVFISGEAGVGKTTVVELVLARLAAGSVGAPGARAHRPRRAAALCTAVAGATPRAGERVGAGAASRPSVRDDASAHAARAR